MTDVQRTIDIYSNQWEAIKAELIRHHEAIANLRKAEQEAHAFDPREDYLYSTLFSYKHELYESLREIATSIIHRLVRLAEQHLGGQSQLKIESEKYKTEFTREVDRDVDFAESKLNKFNPMSVWEAIQAEYGEGKGEEKGLSQAAKNIINCLDLREGDTMTMKSGYYTLDLSMYLDSFDKKYGKNRYAYSSRDSFIMLIKAFEVFLGWADSYDSAIGLKRYMYKICDYHAQVESRKKYVCGDNFMFITFNNRIEFRLTKELGEKLQVFLGLYGIMPPKGASW
jgi:hypothetical protein